MPKFILTVGRDATIYYSAEVEAENIEEIQTQMTKNGYDGETLTEWEMVDSQVFDNVEQFIISTNEGAQLFNSAD
jgi:hypothetical protein